jgi:hypothetical protein
MSDPEVIPWCTASGAEIRLLSGKDGDNVEMPMSSAGVKNVEAGDGLDNTQIFPGS